MFCFIKKGHERKEGNPPSYFYKEPCKLKNRKMSTTNIKGPKNIWIPKIEKSSCDVDNDTDSFSSSE